MCHFIKIFLSDYEFLADGSKSKPWISLSGDDDGNHYIMYPKSEDPFDWEYDLQLIIETGMFLISLSYAMYEDIFMAQ